MNKAKSGQFNAKCHFFVILAILVMPVSCALDRHMKTKTIIQETACGHCDGPCFQGHCLFELNEVEFHSLDKQGNHSVKSRKTHLTSMVKSETQKQRSSVEFHALDHKGKHSVQSRSIHLESMVKSEIQKQRPSAGNVPRQASSLGSFSIAESNHHSEGGALEHQADPSRSSRGNLHASQGEVAFLSKDASNFRAKVQADEERLMSLSEENAKLRSENTQMEQKFHSWATALAQITAREARMAEIIGGTGNEPSGPESWDPSKAENWKRHSWGFMEWLVNIPSEFKDTVATIQGLIFMVAFAFAAFVMYKYRSRVLMLLFDTEEVKLGWQDVLWFFISCCGLCHRPLKPLGRAVGLTYQAVEISEIQIGHLPAQGDVFVKIDIGTNPLIHTRTINKSDGIFLRFKEVFKVNVRKTDPPCVFQIIDQDILMHDHIAKVELDAWQFVNLAHKGNKDGKSGYYRFDLQHSDGRIKKPPTKGEIRPYIAMRLRAVSKDEKFKGFGGSMNAQRSQRDFLATLESQPGQTHFTRNPQTNELNLP